MDGKLNTNKENKFKVLYAKNIFLFFSCTLYIPVFTINTNSEYMYYNYFSQWLFFVSSVALFFAPQPCVCVKIFVKELIFVCLLNY